MAISQLTSCLMASCLLLSTSAAEARVRDDDDTARPAGSQPPQIKAQYPATLVVQLGSAVRILCPVYGDPGPLVSWTKDSDNVHLGWQRFHVQRGGASLHITEVRTADSGRYTCEATNGFGTAVVTINLRVVPDPNNASHYDLEDLQVTSLDAGPTVSSGDSDVTSLSDSVTSDVAAADTDNDVMMTSLLCVGAVVCVLSLGVLVFLAARRRLKAVGDKRVVVPVSAAQRLLAIAAAAASSTPTEADENTYYAPQPTTTTTVLGDKWTTSHVTAMKLLITGHRHDLWAADTCFV